MLFQILTDPTKLLPSDTFTFILPWIFTFAVVYGVLDKVDIFGTDKMKKQTNLVLSLVFAFFVTAAAGPEMAVFFTSILENFIVWAVGIIVLIIFLEITGQSLFTKNNGMVLGATILIGALLFFGAGGGIPGLEINDTTASYIFWGIILLVVIYYVKKE